MHSRELAPLVTLMQEGELGWKAGGVAEGLKGGLKGPLGRKSIFTVKVSGGLSSEAGGEP